MRPKPATQSPNRATPTIIVTALNTSQIATQNPSRTAQNVPQFLLQTPPSALPYSAPPEMRRREEGSTPIRDVHKIKALSIEDLISEIMVHGLAMNPQGFGIARDCTDDGNSVLVGNAIIGI
ncbi:hypothetical protein RHSIM_Rhsim09G0050200 [Rhododendron simsii]|uniref:Uncharacterized protein n=1 Tax=Rhododendron simsii TaxID=118357 RepID=A0A834GLC5_RHOSS|nr:hypothetical protein RHSIM_Rhsim09G0050200 [Rhododendron simsii]